MTQPPITNTIEDELKRLPKLYRMTGRDWIIEVSNIITEPVCPTVLIYEEENYDYGTNTKELSRYKKRFDAETFLEAVRAAVNFVLSDLENIKKQCPKEAE